MTASTSTVIIGAGHAGLAMSRRLTERSIDHVVLERGEVANSWRTERWPGLRLLTPNWLTELPGGGYRGDDPDGYMGAAEVASFVSGYATSIDAPVRTGTTVSAVRPSTFGYRVLTDQGEWTAPTVVLASGASNLPHVPALADALPREILSITPRSYPGPGELPEGGVLVVGGSASGVQLAAELQGAGKAVTLSMGEHVRLPRRYRGRDIFWWMDAAGVLDQRYDEVDDIVRARNVPSPQLIGSPEQVTLDVNALRGRGVRVVGRLGAIVDGVMQFAGSLPNVCKLADLKLRRLLAQFDTWADEQGLDGIDPPDRLDDTRLDLAAPLQLDLAAEGITTVLWATGYRPDHSWVELPVFDRKGSVRHDGGVVENASGLYLVGQPFLRRRRSTFIAGASADSAELADHLHRTLDRRSTA